MIERRPRPDSDCDTTDRMPAAAREIEIEFSAIFPEQEVELADLLEYGVGSVIDLGSADQIRARVRFGGVDFAEGKVVTIHDRSPDDDNQTETHQKAPARPRLGVHLDDVSWQKLGDILRS